MSVQPVTAATPLIDRKVVKPTPADLMEDAGTGLDYGTRPDRMPGYVTSTDRFFIRNHAPTPRLDTSTWTLHVEGNGVREPMAYSYADLWNRFPLVSMIRTLECAGNRRVLFGEECGRVRGHSVGARGDQHRRVDRRPVTRPARTGRGHRGCLRGHAGSARRDPGSPADAAATAWADDTLVALAMNGDVLPPDHGFPARLVVSGWLGVASIKWLGRNEVSEEPLYVPWNT
jgi:DMSO/TMAO reductase YedYZ molybdopterin-dependent catalytic subunit